MHFTNRRCGESRRERALRIELGIPIKIIHPAIVQIVWRKQPAVAVQLMHRRREWRLARKHPRLLRRQIALAQVARRAGRDDVLPGGLAALAARDDVIERKVVVRRAILADEAVAQEDVKTGEGGVRARLDERFERHHARELNLEGRAAHRAVVMFDDVDAVEKHRLDRVLPGPERQRVVAQRPEIRVQDQYRPTALRDMCVQVTLLASIYAAKQPMLTYYMQRDGIVKSVEGLIQQARLAQNVRLTPTAVAHCGGMMIRREHA